jgi:hypothetical protein
VVATVAAAVVVPVVLTSGGGTTQHLVVSPAISVTPTVSSPASPLPTTLPLPHSTPATLAAIVGRWRAATPAPGVRRGFVQFYPDGTWGGSDGCNSLDGPVHVGAAGMIHASLGFSTYVFCSVVSPEAGWLEAAKRASIVGSRLFLNGVNGNLLGELVRTSPPPRVGQVFGKFGWAGGPAPVKGRSGEQLLSGSIAVHFRTAKGRVVARTRAVDGLFTISLSPGRYVFVGTSRAPRWVCSSPVTTVRAGRAVRVDALCVVP